MARCASQIAFVGASYRLGYDLEMETRELLYLARQAEGLTQEAAARRAGTSQPTWSAYERGTKSPTLPVLERIVHALGYELDLIPQVQFTQVHLPQAGRTIHIPDRLWRLHPHDCMVPIPKTITRSRHYTMVTHKQRLEAYIWLLEHGTPDILRRHLDAALLLEYWREMTPSMHPDVVHEWRHVVTVAEESWWIDELREGFEARKQQPITRAAQIRAIRQMMGYGLSRQEILRVLRLRPRA